MEPISSGLGWLIEVWWGGDYAPLKVKMAASRGVVWICLIWSCCLAALDDYVPVCDFMFTS